MTFHVDSLSCLSKLLAVLCPLCQTTAHDEVTTAHCHYPSSTNKNGDGPGPTASATPDGKNAINIPPPPYQGALLKPIFFYRGYPLRVFPCDCALFHHHCLANRIEAPEELMPWQKALYVRCPQCFSNIETIIEFYEFGKGRIIWERQYALDLKGKKITGIHTTKLVGAPLR